MGCILLVIIGLGWSLLAGEAGLPVLTPTLHLPAIGIPAWDAISEAAIGAFWPQLALTLTNAVLLTSVLAADYFPSARPSASAKRLAMSSSALNLLLAPIGAVPMCQGAGGLAIQYHQGARTGLAPIVFGLVTYASWTCRTVIPLTALVSFGVNVAVGLAAGLIIELIRSTVSNLRQPTV